MTSNLLMVIVSRETFICRCTRWQKAGRAYFQPPPCHGSEPARQRQDAGTSNARLGRISDDGVDSVPPLEQARRVGEKERNAANDRGRLQDIAGGPGDCRDYGRVPSTQQIEKARLPAVRR